MFDNTMFVLAANIPIKIIYKFQLFHSKHLHTKIKLMKPIKMKIKYSASHCTTNRTQTKRDGTRTERNRKETERNGKEGSR